MKVKEIVVHSCTRSLQIFGISSGTCSGLLMSSGASCFPLITGNADQRGDPPPPTCFLNREMIPPYPCQSDSDNQCSLSAQLALNVSVSVLSPDAALLVISSSLCNRAGKEILLSRAGEGWEGYVSASSTGQGSASVSLSLSKYDDATVILAIVDTTTQITCPVRLQPFGGSFLGINASSTVVRPAKLVPAACGMPSFALVGRCASWCLSNATRAGGVVSDFGNNTLLITLLPVECAGIPVVVQFIASFDSSAAVWIASVPNGGLLTGLGSLTSLSAALTPSFDGTVGMTFSASLPDEDPVTCPTTTVISVSYLRCTGIALRFSDSP